MTDLTPERQTEREEVLSKARAAKQIAPQLAKLPTPQKNDILLAAADDLVSATDEILAANQQDIDTGRERGLAESLIDRLSLDAERIEGIAGGLRQVAGLKDPVGEVLQGGVMSNGIQMKQVRVPLGVMGMVYEARPNVTVDAFGLALADDRALEFRKRAEDTEHQVRGGVVGVGGKPQALLVKDDGHALCGELGDQLFEVNEGAGESVDAGYVQLIAVA